MPTVFAVGIFYGLICGGLCAPSICRAESAWTAFSSISGAAYSSIYARRMDKTGSAYSKSGHSGDGEPPLPRCSSTR